MCLAQGHNTVTLVKLQPVALRLEFSSLPLTHCARPILLLQCEGQALPNAREGVHSIQSIKVSKSVKPTPGPEVITSFSAQLN